MAGLKEPRVLGDVVGLLSMEMPHNQAVCDLAYDFRAQKVVGDVLKEWGQTRFIPLIGVHASAQISLPLYVGNGLVAKITPARFEDRQPKPLVLPAIKGKTVESDYVEYHVQMYPFVATGSLTQTDVEIMRDQLAAVGYRFANGDDRPDNLGRLPGGKLVVLDHGATETMPGKRAKLGDADEWLADIRDIYGDLYGPEGVKPQGPDTSFVKRPAPPQMTLHTNFGKQAGTPKAPKADNENRPLWRQVLGLGR
ncbi:MAG TPA: hypothetical protein DFI00_11870 [Rhodospirillaceae bacterium]|nr:hypothetical protein [Alphaproteobacteria bacterium]OUT42070.1 MAG: hypothetical protein CBB62_07150 [Micavibrio sp. TMED2]HCI47985.1 hypothetical protein [Rhodospirillaceae bacterium]MAS46320.1 hypothetical protein [Alphaproteobacteria bacterium]MAX95494.1 hypothetical protein [Alphaproteobacteria bacterium]|tara:strand:+ start:5299 stop:6054 length:756 start_codon:yes stop_codon:yes gene_type:complete